MNPYITADGKRLYYSSTRPSGGTGDAKDSDIWYVERTADGVWGEPIRLDKSNTAGKDDYYTSISKEGTLYFSVFEGRGGSGDIYRSRVVGGEYAPPERIEYPISSKSNEHDPFIAPDESYLIFTSDRPGGHGKGDLYISFRAADGTWTEPRNMGEKINSSAYDYCAMLSADGRYLFFTRNINRQGDIYWIDAKIIEGLNRGE